MIIEELECKRCGHKWLPRPSKSVSTDYGETWTDKKPVLCPKCKSPYWDKERKNKKKVKESTPVE